MPTIEDIEQEDHNMNDVNKSIDNIQNSDIPNESIDLKNVQLNEYEIIEITASQKPNKSTSMWTTASIKYKGTTYKISDSTKTLRKMNAFNEKWNEWKSTSNKKRKHEGKLNDDDEVANQIETSRKERTNFLIVEKKENIEIDIKQVKTALDIDSNNIVKDAYIKDAVIVSTKNNTTATKISEYCGNKYSIYPINSDKDNIRTMWIKAKMDNNNFKKEEQCQHIKEQVETYYEKLDIKIVYVNKIGSELFIATCKTPLQVKQIAEQNEIQVDSLEGDDSSLGLTISRVEHIELITFYDIILYDNNKVDLSISHEREIIYNIIKFNYHNNEEFGYFTMINDLIMIIQLRNIEEAQKLINKPNFGLQNLGITWARSVPKILPWIKEISNKNRNNNIKKTIQGESQKNKEDVNKLVKDLHDKYTKDLDIMRKEVRRENLNTLETVTRLCNHTIGLSMTLSSKKEEVSELRTEKTLAKFRLMLAHDEESKREILKEINEIEVLLTEAIKEKQIAEKSLMSFNTTQKHSIENDNMDDKDDCEPNGTIH